MVTATTNAASLHEEGAGLAHPPDFVIIGAAKAGTTTLYEYLVRHPELCLSTEKEPEFFADNFARGWAWYASLFAHQQPGQQRGEASTVYTFARKYEQVAERMALAAPHARLIYMLRHPVERLYSDYHEQLKTARIQQRERPELRSFETFIEGRPHLVQASEYIRYVRTYERCFSPDALLCVLLEDLARDPHATLARICEHIGVTPTHNLADRGPIRANETRAFQQWQVRVGVTAWLRRIPGVRPLVSAVVPRSWRDAAYRLLERTARADAIRRQIAQPPLLPETRQRLLDRYAASTREIEDYLGRSLPHWHE